LLTHPDPLRLKRCLVLTTALFCIAACVPAAQPTTAPTDILVTVPPSATPTAALPTETPDLPPPAAEIARAAASNPQATVEANARMQLEAMRTPESPEMPSLILSEQRQWTRSELECETGGEDDVREIDGYLLYYALRENVYEFHADNGTAVRLCAVYEGDELYDERPELFLQIDPVAADLADLAIERVAAELDLPEARIRVVSARPMVWDDASLGCPVEGEFYALQVIEGYRIVVEAAERQYVFHSNFDRLVMCEGGITPTPSPSFTPTRTARAATRTPSDD
jgi:hypothetical protein